MKLPRFRFVKIKSFRELFNEWIRYGSGANVVAGGTDLFPRMKYRLVKPEVVISLNGLERLKGINVDESGMILIGALTTIHQVSNSEIIRKYAPSLCDATQNIASNQIRRMGTIGGNICLETRCLYFNQSHTHQFIEPCFKRGGNKCYMVPKGKKCIAVHMADTVPALISLGAQLVLRGKHGTKNIPLENFYTGDSIKPHILHPYEIVESISLNHYNGIQGSAYVKHTLRGGLEFGIVGIGVRLRLSNNSKRCSFAKIVIGCVSGGPLCASDAEQVLMKNELNNEIIKEAAKVAAESVSAYPHHGYSLQYIRDMIRVHVKKGIELALNRATAQQY